MNWKWVIVLGLLVSLIILAGQNYKDISVNFLSWSFKTNTSIAGLALICAGLIIGWMKM